MQLRQVRAHIDEVDAQIACLLRRRLALGIEAADARRAGDRDPHREQQVIDHYATQAGSDGLTAGFQEVAEAIIRMTRDHQNHERSRRDAA